MASPNKPPTSRHPFLFKNHPKKTNVALTDDLKRALEIQKWERTHKITVCPPAWASGSALTGDGPRTLVDGPHDLILPTA